MDATSSLLDYLSIYDLFARMVAGAVVLLMSSLLGIFDSTIGSSDAFAAIAFIVFSYFTGIILEEMSHILENIFGFRKKWEKQFCRNEIYRKYSYIKCKKALARNGNNDLLDKSLSHIVMSSSISIGFIILILTKIGLLVFSLVVHKKDAMTTCFECIPVVAILIFMIVILQFRKRNYIEMRVQQIFDFCIAKGYEDIYRDSTQRKSACSRKARKKNSHKKSI